MPRANHDLSRELPLPERSALVGAKTVYRKHLIAESRYSKHMAARNHLAHLSHGKVLQCANVTGLRTEIAHAAPSAGGATVTLGFAFTLIGGSPRNRRWSHQY